MSERRRGRVIQIGIMVRHPAWARRRHYLSAEDLLRPQHQPMPDRT